MLDANVGEAETRRTADTGIEETENLIATYEVNAEWIRFADAKAGVVLTVNGVFASLLISTLHDLIRADRGWPAMLASVLLPISGTAVVASCFAAFQCILPLRRKGRHPAVGLAPHFHSAATAATYSLDETRRFIDDFRRLGVDGFRDEVLASILVDAHVSGAKYSRVVRSVRLLAVAVAAGFSYLAVLQWAVP